MGPRAVAKEQDRNSCSGTSAGSRERSSWVGNLNYKCLLSHNQTKSSIYVLDVTSLLIRWGFVGKPTGPALPYTGEVTRKFAFRSVAGVMVETPIGERLSIEVDGLYRRLSYENDPSVVVTWEIPVLAKYRLSTRTLVPFVEGGPSFRVAGNLNSTNPSHHRLAVGVGTDIRLRRFKIAPAIRY